MRFLTKNWGWKLLSLAIAFAFWANIASEPELAAIFTAPVEYKNYPKDLEISSAIIETIDVEARGPSGRLRDMTESPVTAVVDLSSITAPGERTFTLTDNEVGLPRGIDLIRTIPAQLRFRFEKRLRRKLKVEVPLAGTLPPGLWVTRVDVFPAELEIAGPESRVAVAKRPVTDPVELSQLRGDSQQTLAVYNSEPAVRFTGTPRVTVKIHVSRNR